MSTTISLEGTLECKSSKYGFIDIHGVPKETWVCKEDPSNVLLKLAATHRINEYRGIDIPFSTSIKDYGLVGLVIDVAKRVQTSRVPYLKDLMYSINKPRMYQPTSDYCEDFGFIYHKPILYCPLLRTSRTLKQNREKFIRILRQNINSFNKDQVKSALEILKVLGFKNPREYLKSLI